jgi:hypothetical protein
MTMKRFYYILFFVMLIVFPMMNCTLQQEPENPFAGVWRSVRPDNTDYQRLTVEEDMTFVMEEYRDGVFVQVADGSVSYDNNSCELTIILDNLLDDDIYGPPTEGKPAEIIKYTTINADYLLMSCLLGGDTETLVGNWSMIEKNTIVPTNELEVSVVLNLTPGGILHYSMIWSNDGEVTVSVSCEASYSIVNNQIVVTNSTDETIMANNTYSYMIVDQGLYFSYMAGFENYPFYREE